MSETLDLVLRIAAIGMGATLVLDLWSLVLKTAFHAPAPNYAMVGRWIGSFSRGQFAHDAIAKAPAIAGEHAIGWIAHYAIGVLYAVFLVGFAGVDWLSAPTLTPALMVGVATIVAPLFIMQPAMGHGIASSKTPNPNLARVRSLLAHTVFGFGLYLSASLLTFV